MIREGRTLDHPPVAEGHPRAGEKKPLRPVFARPARLLWLPALECNPANPRAATLLSNSSVAKNSFSLPLVHPSSLVSLAVSHGQPVRLRFHLLKYSMCTLSIDEAVNPGSLGMD